MKTTCFCSALPARVALPLLLTFLTVSAAHAQYNINGVPYTVSEPHETLAATFTVPDGGVTTNLYKGYVLVNVTGVGQSYANVYNDAFYLYTNHFSNPPKNGHDGAYYQLGFDTKPLVSGNFSRNAKNFLYGSLPTYNPLHDYTFILNTGLSNAGQLHFGVTDAGYSDNTGAYTIKVTQLTPTPAPSALMTILVGTVPGGLLLRRRRRK